MKAKDQAYYQKLVFAGQWKKVTKVMTEGGQQEKDWVLEALGQAAVRSDECYNQLVVAFQGAADKPTKLSAIKALGSCSRSAALSQMEYAASQTQDPELLEAIAAARHSLKSK